jgi:transposase
MVIIGSDSHKATHTFVAVDGNGCQLAQKVVRATPAGHVEGLRWASQWPERHWALEDVRHVSRRLEADLLSAGEAVTRVPPKLMAGARKAARTPGKSDPIDALAVARAALREPGLPLARLEGPSRELRLLIDHREHLVAERTRHQNRLHWHLHELEPGYRIKPGTLDRYKTLNELGRLLDGHQAPVAEIARQLLDMIRALTVTIKELERTIAERVSKLAPALLTLYGCGALTAAKIVGEVAGIDRFRSRAAFAMHNGTAPIPASSGNTQRDRLNRGGNRQLNAAIYRIAITQLQRYQPAVDYIERRMAEKKTKPEAIRALKRRISDAVYIRLLNDERQRQVPVGQFLAAA